MTASLWLRSDRLAVEVTPGQGADITSIVEPARDINILFRTPFGQPGPTRALMIPDSQVEWLTRYPGGWQQLVPNAGAERTVGGVRRGYHGEAASIAWSVEAADNAGARMSTELTTTPLHLTRTLSLDGATLRVRDTIHNTGDQPVPVMWVQHPGFGAPFIDEHCVLTTGARTVLTDAEAPGTLLPPDTRASFPRVPTADGGTVDLRAVPGPASARAVFACLTDFTEGWYQIDSPTLGFGVRVAWNPTVLPHAWFWQECCASSGFPWYQRAYVVAVEPANVLPGDPSPAEPGRGDAPLLPGGRTWTSDITLTLTELADREGQT